jgi:hypothetical protein
VAAFEAELARTLPGFGVRYKDESRLQRLIGVVLKPICPTYCTQYTTVMFGKVYFPSRAWRERVGPKGIYATLRHEAVHLRDARRWPLIFQLSYLLCLPTVLTARAWWEWRGYRETLRVELELTGEIPDALLDFVQARFTGADYGFMCPFPRFVRRALERERARLVRVDGEGGRDHPPAP